MNSIDRLEKFVSEAARIARDKVTTWQNGPPYPGAEERTTEIDRQLLDVTSEAANLVYAIKTAGLQ